MDLFGDIEYTYEPKKTTAAADCFSDENSFNSSDSDLSSEVSDSASSEESSGESSRGSTGFGVLSGSGRMHGSDRPRSNDYETFLFGFFYFFIMQDPYVRHYLSLKHTPTQEKTSKILKDLEIFQAKYML